MKDQYLYLFLIVLFIGCKPKQKAINFTEKQSKNEVFIDLVNIHKDKVKIELMPAKINSESAIFYIPRIIPGTYSSDNYGSFITEVTAYTKGGQILPVSRLGKNSWRIANVAQLYKLTYWVDDTFDNEHKHEVFSPSGTNILKDKNYLLNLHGFVGYFKETKELPYLLSVVHTKNVSRATSRDVVLGINPKLKKNETDQVDSFYYNRYSEVVDDPILYANQDIEKFKVNDIEIILSVYSPNKIHTAKSLLPTIKRMMNAQKSFMGNINSTKKYSILLYLSEYNTTDASGFGALEHNNSTVVVMPERSPKKILEESLIDIVAHEFFHIITPLTIHSEEIHNFDYNAPKMSKHLWMYEGTTEYFAQLFQIKEGLISKEEFFKRVVQKIEVSRTYNDYMSFTKMSENILEEPYKKNYNNVYYKGALISMCIDILIRKHSNGKKGILDLMKLLSDRYGAKRPFLDEKLIEVITMLTYPEVGAFLDEYVVKGKSINYADFFKHVGLKYGVSTLPTEYFMENKEVSYIFPNQKENKIYFGSNVSKSSFFKELKIQPNDILVAVNGKKYDLNNVQHLFEISKKWIKGSIVIVVVNRNGKEITTEAIIKEGPTSLQKSVIEIPEINLTEKQIRVKNTWLN